MSRTRSLLLGAALAFACAAPCHAETARLTILHTTDLHGSLDGWDYARDSVAARGLTRVATLVRAARAENPHTLLLDAGDVIEGGIETPYRMGPQSRPDPMIAAMNALGYDAMTVGNHEFDLGWRTLDRARGAARFPWLAANITRQGAAATGHGLFTPSIVKQVGPLRVGIVGVCTPAVPRFLDSTSVKSIVFGDPVAAARREVQRLRDEQHCAAVVLVAHTGLEQDPATGAERRGDAPDENWGYRLATQVPGVDVLVLGHTHVVVPSAEIAGANGPLITQAGRFGDHLGRVDLDFQRSDPGAAWQLKARRATAIAVTDSTIADPALAKLARPYHDEARTVLGLPVGTVDRDLDAPAGRFAPGPAWDLIHRAQLAATGADVSLAALPDPTVRIAAGTVSRRDLLRLYPYGNTLDLVEMTGAELTAALEQSARYFATYSFTDAAPLVDPAYPAYNFDGAYGVTYDIDLTQPPGHRITHLAFHGAPVAPEQRLKVAVNSYRMNGGGGFDAVRYARRLQVRPQTVRDAIARLIAKPPSADAANAAAAVSWTLLPDWTRCPERPIVDRMVRLGGMPKDDVLRLDPFAAASEDDVRRWIARAFGAAPSSGDARAADSGPAGAITRGQIADLCARAAAAAGYDGVDPRGGATAANVSFVGGLVTGTTLAWAGDAAVPTRIQAIAMVANARFPMIRVLETTDFHGAILPGQKERRTGRAIGGSPALAAEIARLRGQNPQGTVLIDGGDLFQGTMISNLQFGRPVVEQMNALGYTCAAVGNHEFDWGVDTLSRRAREMHFAELGANMREKATGKMPSWVRSDTTVTRRGAKISVFGLCYRYTPSVTLAKNVAALEFLDDSTVAAGLAPKLRPRCDVLLGVGHIPAETDSTHRLRSGDLKRLAGVRGVDAWFGGHSHNLVADSLGGIPFAIAGSHGTTVAVCDMTVDPKRHAVLERHLELRTVYADEVTIDSAWVARVDRWNSAIAPIASQALGANEHRLTRARGGESTVGDFVADAMREVSGADVALQNSGGLRADLEAGTVTRGSIYEVMPFDNTIYTLKLTGDEVKQALEQGLRNGRVTQISGIRYAYDTSLPAMQRVTSLTLANGDPLDPQKLYVVAVNDFMATGGDDYNVLAGGKDRNNTGILVRQVMEDYVRKLTAAGKSLDYEDAGRITRAAAAPRDSTR